MINPADHPHASRADSKRRARLVALALPAFSDNYLWLVHNGCEAVVVDPGDASVVARALESNHLQLIGILITHHHADHIGGLLALKAEFDVPVYGPRAEAQKIPGLTRLLDQGDTVRVESLDLHLNVLAVPGHTLGHIAYHAAEHDWLFCGDTLFAGGCGRLFEGTPQQMYASLQKLAQLPPQTEVYCAHEYTLSNLAFAHAADPDNAAVNREIERVWQLRASSQPSIPSTIGRERAVNPFLRCELPELAAHASAHAQNTLPDAVSVFAELRRWKDAFRAA